MAVATPKSIPIAVSTQSCLDITPVVSLIPVKVSLSTWEGRTCSLSSSGRVSLMNLNLMKEAIIDAPKRTRKAALWAGRTPHLSM